MPTVCVCCSHLPKHTKNVRSTITTQQMRCSLTAYWTWIEQYDIACKFFSFQDPFSRRLNAANNCKQLNVPQKWYAPGESNGTQNYSLQKAYNESECYDWQTSGISPVLRKRPNEPTPKHPFLCTPQASNDKHTPCNRLPYTYV